MDLLQPSPFLLLLILIFLIMGPAALGIILLFFLFSLIF